jgi:hypothetical protein
MPALKKPCFSFYDNNHCHFAPPLPSFQDNSAQQIITISRQRPPRTSAGRALLPPTAPRVATELTFLRP